MLWPFACLQAATLRGPTSCALAHWGFEFDGLDFFETLVPGAMPAH
jgi:hypothetical protein